MLCGPIAIREEVGAFGSLAFPILVMPSAHVFIRSYGLNNRLPRWIDANAHLKNCAAQNDFPSKIDKLANSPQIYCHKTTKHECELLCYRKCAHDITDSWTPYWIFVYPILSNTGHMFPKLLYPKKQYHVYYVTTL